MPPLETLSVGKRILLAAIIIAVTLLLLLFAISHFFVEPADAQGPPKGAAILYEGVPLDAKLLALDKRALDEAYHAQLQKLWGVWLADGAKQSQYIKTGLAIARRAYGEVVEQIQVREKQIEQQGAQSPR